MDKIRLFLKDSDSRLKKICSIELKGTKTEPKWIRVQLCSSLFCKILGLPLNAEIHHHCTSNGIGSHLTIKHHDIQNQAIIHDFKYYYGRDNYTFKQYYSNKNYSGPGLSAIQTLPLSNSPILQHLAPGYPPDPFDKYMMNKLLPFHFGSMGIPLGKVPELGDQFRKIVCENDIVIDELEYPNDRIHFHGFLSSKNHYVFIDDDYWKVRVISVPGLPDYGIIVHINRN